ncbi:MAG: hypothetical protein KAU48_12485 [Candidatus Thorarchaeota archaeon]|nr:hypothetical protein [Candidatus Thorarchaeota archaeon]
MRWRKRTKTIDDISVEKLLDDFASFHVEDDSKHANDIDDDEYVSMMLKKDANRKLERLKRNHTSTEHGEIQRKSEDLEASTSSDESVEILQHHNEPEKIEGPVESVMLPEDEAIIEDIMKSQSIEDIPALTGRMKVAVDFVQWEMGSSVSNKKPQRS